MKLAGTILTALSGVALVMGCDSGVSPKKEASGRPNAAKITATSRLGDARPAFIEKQPLTLGGKCNLEYLNEKPWVSEAIVPEDKTSFAVKGWGVDDQRKLLPTVVYLRLQDAGNRDFYASMEPDKDLRPDVAQYFGEEYGAKSGFHGQVSAESLPPGEYQAMIVMDVAGQSILCANGRKLKF